MWGANGGLVKMVGMGIGMSGTGKEGTRCNNNSIFVYGYYSDLHLNRSSAFSFPGGREEVC